MFVNIGLTRLYNMYMPCNPRWYLPNNTLSIVKGNSPGHTLSADPCALSAYKYIYPFIKHYRISNENNIAKVNTEHTGIYDLRSSDRQSPFSGGNSVWDSSQGALLLGFVEACVFSTPRSQRPNEKPALVGKQII